MTSSAGSADDTVPAGYVLDRALGEGQFGRALLCRDAADRSIVVRISGITGDRAAALEAELRSVAAAASHPCAVAIPKVWTDPELGVCFAQVHCPGVATGPVDAEAAAIGGVRLAAALAHAHRLGLLHGDLRPDDVMLDADGNWLLADGGVLDAIRRARPDLAVERDSLFSPRELRGWESPAESADVYSLGATLRALLGETAVEAAMDALLGRMLAPNPADRPSLVEVDEVLRAEVPAAAQAALPARPAGPRPVAPPPRPTIRLADSAVVPAVASDRRRMLVVAGAIGAVFVVAAGGVAVANSGGSHGAATQAAATASMAPSARLAPGGTSSTAVNSGSLQPKIILIELRMHNGSMRPYIQWQMPTMSPAVKGWNIYAVNPDHFATVVRDGFYPAGSTTPTGKLAVQWYFGGKVPLNWCTRVDTVVEGSAPSPSQVLCQDPSDVKKAEATNAELAAAAKKAAAKKKSHSA